MKQNLEDIIKEQLENFEAPYDSSAWGRMNDKLDARSNQGKAPRSSSKILKLISAATVISVVAVLVYNYSNTSETINVESVEILETKETEAKNKVDTPEKESINHSEKQTEEPIKKSKKTDESDNLVKESPTQKNEVVTKKETSTETETPSKSETDTNSEVPSVNTPKETVTDENRKATVRRKFISGVVSSSKICEGESLVIKNEGQSDEYVRVRYDNTDLTIPSGQQSQLTLNESTEIQFLNDKGEVLSVADVAVYKNPQVDFSVEANIFDKGLPIVNLKAYGSYKSYNWEIDDKVYEGKSAQSHLFNKGTYNAKLTVVDHNSCKTDKERSISIESDYNLMAVSGFRPEGSDHRNRTFMPYALTQRDVEFTMVIIDSRDHGIVFKTQNANQPWDGIDQRTGKMTPPDRAYIWKVQLDNTLEGEKNVYVGTIVHD